VVLIWLKSYLSDRSYTVIYAGYTSGKVLIICSVPQGSVLEPLLFVLYTSDISDVAARHSLKPHSFADDTQLYTHCVIVWQLVQQQQCLN